MLAAALAVLALAMLALCAWSLRERRRLSDASRWHQATLQALIEATPDAVMLRSRDGKASAHNEAWTRLEASREAEPGDPQAAPRRRTSRMTDEGTPGCWRELHTRPDGARMLLETHSHPVRAADGSALGLLSITRDITTERENEQRLMLAAEVFDHAAEGIVITDTDAVIKAVNPAFCRITGYSAEEMIGQRPSKLASGRQDRAYYEHMWQTLLATGQWQGEIWNRRKSGEIYPEWLNISSVTNDDGQLTHFVGIFSDVSLIKSHEARLQHMAHHDPLTDLPNRALLTDRMDLALRRAAREEHLVGVIFADLDHFKQINDSFGHALGDQVLKAAASRIGAALRDGDTVARLGGDEFVALLEGIDAEEDAEHAARRIFANLAEPMSIDGHELYVGVSVGIALFPRDGASSDELLRNADAAMYQAKRHGRNNAQSYAAVRTEEARQRSNIELALRAAVAREAIEVAYQPQFDTASGALVGAEALARWRDPELGEISPAQFIPIAESNGLIHQVGEIVLRKVCRRLCEWHAKALDPPRIAVNVSGRQLRRAEFVDRLRAILDETGCRAEWLEIEVTESVMLHDADHSIAALNRIRQLGFSISLDDFGTGYSSFSHLRRLPVHTLKVDRSFTDALPGKASDRAIFEAILALGGAMRLKVVAEGVETEDQAAYLGTLGCGLAQGFLYARPLEAEALAELLAGARRASDPRDA